MPISAESGEVGIEGRFLGPLLSGEADSDDATGRITEQAYPGSRAQGIDDPGLLDRPPSGGRLGPMATQPERLPDVLLRHPGPQPVETVGDLSDDGTGHALIVHREL